MKCEKCYTADSVKDIELSGHKYRLCMACYAFCTWIVSSVSKRGLI